MRIKDNYRSIVFNTDPDTYSVIGSVLGQLSDGIWENSNRMDKYWLFADIFINPQGWVELRISKNLQGGWSDWRVRNGFYGLSWDKIVKFFRNKIKQVVRIEFEDKKTPLDWSIDNKTGLGYMYDHVNEFPNQKVITVSDAYKVWTLIKNYSEKDK